jgi:phosphoglycerate dehydrogenase-like enzyme
MSRVTRVLVACPPLTSSQHNALSSVSPNVELIHRPELDSPGIVAELMNHPDLEVLFTAWLPAPWTPTGGVRWVHVAGVGVDDAHDTPLWHDSSILLTNSSGVHAAAISQWVTAMILHHAHRLGDVLGLSAAQDWSNREAHTAHLLLGKTLGILGYGSIGAECGRLGRALGMRVLAARHASPESKSAPRARWIPPELGERADTDERIGFVPLDTLLHEADYLVSTAPLTAATAGLIGSREIGLMKASAYLINVRSMALAERQPRPRRAGIIGATTTSGFA